MTFLGNAIQNFRDEYERKHEATCILTNEQIVQCWADNSPGFLGAIEGSA